MFVSCPKCKAKYQLDVKIKNVILVCHHCDTEFSVGQIKEAAAAQKKMPTIAVFSSDSEVEISEVVFAEKVIIPKRGKTRIWPWLILVLLCIAAFGIWNNQKQWLSQSWVRGLMMNMNLPISSEPDDWELVKESLNTQWVDRLNGSRVLVVNGFIHNRLLSDQMPPSIGIRFFDVSASSAVETRNIAISEPPTLAKIQHAPYLSPPIDQIPVRAGGRRAFTLVLEDIPEQYQQISMRIVTPKMASIDHEGAAVLVNKPSR